MSLNQHPHQTAVVAARGGGVTLDVFRRVEGSRDVPAEMGAGGCRLIKELGCQRQRSLRKDKSVHAVLHFLPKAEGGKWLGGRWEDSDGWVGRGRGRSLYALFCSSLLGSRLGIKSGYTYDPDKRLSELDGRF